MILIASFLISGCVDNKIYHWEFEKDYTEVSEILIVEGTFLNAYSDYTVIKKIKISYADELMNDIRGLELKRYGTNLLHPFGRFFIIKFNNGEFDVFSRAEPVHCRFNSDGKLSMFTSWLVCDADKFDELINKYMEIE